MTVLFRNSSRAAFTLIEMMVAVAAGLVLMGVVSSASVSVQWSISATSQYATSMNNENRLLDYIAQDLRRALRVGTRVSGTYSPAKNISSFFITDTAHLAINIPDYYGSNTPDNTAESSFKTSRYKRSSLNTASAYTPSKHKLRHRG